MCGYDVIVADPRRSPVATGNAQQAPPARCAGAWRGSGEGRLRAAPANQRFNWILYDANFAACARGFITFHRRILDRDPSRRPMT